MIRSQRENMWDNAHKRTVIELVKRGLWPGAIPIPLYTFKTKTLKGTP